MEKLVKELTSTNSNKDKIAILNRYKDDKQIREAFRLCCDPFIIFNISKIKPTSTGVHIFYEMFDEFLELTTKLEKREITGNAARDAVNNFMVECTKDTQDVFIKILQKNLKCGASATTLKKVYGKDFVREFKVQLANKYEKENKDKFKDVECWFATPKLDGLRGVLFTKNPHNLSINYDLKKNVLYTRGATEIVGFDHLIEELKQICEENNFEFIDGELYSHNISFETIQGYVMSSKNIVDDNKKEIKFNVFAVGNEEFDSTLSMVMAIKKVNWKKYKYVVPVPYTLVKNDYDCVLEVHEKYLEMGYEGSMLRHPKNYYVWNRTDDLLKFKTFKECDVEVVGFEEGNGRNEGRLGALIVEGEVEGKFTKTHIGSGYSDTLRQEIWDNQKDWIGITVEVKYQNVTGSKDENGNYALRFTKFKKTKRDR